MNLKQKINIPVIGKLPLLGSLPWMLRNPYSFFIKAHSEKGDIYNLNLGLLKVVVLNHPKYAKHVLHDNGKNYRKGGPFWDAVRMVLGNGLPLSEGDFWKRQRRMIQPNFQRKSLIQFFEIMLKTIQDEINTMMEFDWDKPVNIEPIFKNFTMKVVTSTLFGSKIGKKEVDAVNQVMGYIVDHMFLAMVFHSVPNWLISPWRRKFDRYLNKIDQIIYELIENYRNDKSKDFSSLLSILVSSVDDESGEKMSSQQLRDELVSMFLAGHETIATALTWTFYLLGNNLEQLKKVEDEVNNLKDEKMSYESLEKLSFTRMVVKEAMRLYPPIWWIPRTAVEDDWIDGYFIPKNTMVAPMCFTIHRHESFWKKPENFEPERFGTNENKEYIDPYSWIPFSMGQRQCVGVDFAMMEAQLMIAMFLKNFQFELIKDHSVKAFFSTTLRPKNGVLLKLIKRNG